MNFNSEEIVLLESVLKAKGYKKSNSNFNGQDYSWYKNFNNSSDEESKTIIHLCVYDWRKYADRDPENKDRIGIMFNAIIDMPGYDRCDIKAMPQRNESDLFEVIIEKFENHILKIKTNELS